MILQAGDTDTIQTSPLHDGDPSSPTTGLSTVQLLIWRASDGYFYDFDDDTFKASGHTDIDQQMSELDATNAPGVYYYDFDTSSITNAVAAGDAYHYFIKETGGNAKNVPQTGAVQVGLWADSIDADISSRAAPGDAMDLVADAVDADAVAASGANEVRDAILADSTPFNGADVGAILTDTAAIDGRLPADPADESNQIAEHNTTQAAIAALNDLSQADVQAAMTSQGYTPGRAANLDNLDDTISNVRSDIADIAAVTRFRTSAPSPFEIPSAGSIVYKIHVNLEDTSGNPEDPDTDTITVGVTNQSGTDRSANLSSTTMTKLSVGRYEVSYTVSNAHAIEQLIFTFTYDESGVTFVKDMSRMVTDSAEVGYTTSDRSRDNQIAIETAAIDARLPADPADESNQIAEHNTTQAAIAALNNLSIADVQTALTNQGYTAGRAVNLDNLDAAISSLNDLSIADVQTALTNQGYTAGRAALLDNLSDLDAAISSVLSAIGALNDLSQADVQAAMTAQGYTTVRAALLDNLDGAISAVPSAVDSVLSAAHGSGSWETGSGGTTDWSSAEREQIRYRLAMDGVQTDPTTNTGTIEDILADTAAVDSRLPVDPADESNQIAEHNTTQAAIAALNDVDQSDVQAALTAQGYTTVRASNLDNLDVAISSLNNLSIADVQTALDNQGYTTVRASLIDNLDAAISSLNNLSVADVQTALDNQGYSSVRAALLDNLDAAISAVLSAVGALNDLSQADVQSALDTQGYTAVRAALLDNLDAAISAVPTAVDVVLTAAHGAGTWQGGSAGGGWTTAEKEQIRYRLALDGSQTDPTTDTGTIEDILADTTDMVAKMLRVLGLNHENAFIDNMVLDADNQLTSARIRIYDSKANADAATDGDNYTTGLIASYTMESSYTAVGKPDTYRVTLNP